MSTHKHLIKNIKFLSLLTFLVMHDIFYNKIKNQSDKDPLFQNIVMPNKTIHLFGLH